MKKKLILVMLLIFASLPSYSVTYKWIEENGRVNFGDLIPEKYKNKSKKIDILNSRSSTNQTESITKNREERTSESKVEAGGIDEVESNLSKNNPSNELAVDHADCDKQWKQYKASQTCFGKYSLVNGHLKAEEALKNCTDIKQPDCSNYNK
jgi:predicted CopG family antitoxin